MTDEKNLRESIRRMDQHPADVWLECAEWSLKRSYYVLGDEVPDKFQEKYRKIAYNLHLGIQGLHHLYYRKQKYVPGKRRVRSI